MNEDKLKTIVEEVVKNAIEPISKRLDDPENGLQAIKDTLDAHSASLVEIEKTNKIYADMYKINNENSKKLRFGHI